MFGKLIDVTFRQCKSKDGLKSFTVASGSVKSEYKGIIKYSSFESFVNDPEGVMDFEVGVPVELFGLDEYGKYRTVFYVVPGMNGYYRKL